MPQTTPSNRPTLGTPWRRRTALGALGAAALACTLAMTGCVLGQLVGGMAASAERTGSHDVTAKYAGLAGKSFAVVVAADRSVQADFPSVVGDITITVSEELRTHAAPSGWVPPRDVLRYQYEHPSWTSMPLDKLAAEFGVQRLVYVDLREYRLNEPGNAYLWAGLASGTVSVLEADTPMNDQFAFQEPVKVEFPGKSGLGPQQIPPGTVQMGLSRRFVDRVSWMFYDHEEKNYQEY